MSIGWFIAGMMLGGTVGVLAMACIIAGGDPR